VKAPNIIFIFSDQHNASVLGCAGDPYVRTPNIDKLAAKGTMFNNFYCNSPLCGPSRSSMLAGLLPSETGVYNNMQCLPSDKATFVHSLAVAGYETVLSGRMHFVGPDQRHGFEKRFVGDITPSFPGMDNEDEIYGPLKRTSNQNRISIEKSGPGSSAVLCFDEDVTAAACDYMENRDDDRPLFMTVGLYGPHCPYICPKELYDYYYKLLPVVEPITEEFRSALHPAIQDWIQQRKLIDVTAEEIHRIRASYYGMVEYVDRLVGKIVESVESNLGLDNTLIIYASDHGDNIGEHGLFWKTNFYDGASRVPAIFSWKDVIPEGMSYKGTASLLDMAPTLIDIANAPKLPKMQGESLLDKLKSGEDLPKERIVISQLGDIKGDQPSAMIRKGDWKLVLHYGYETPQLFHLESDPGERLDLASDPAHLHVRVELERELRKHWDPEQAYAALQNGIAHFDIIRKWVKEVKVEPLEEWRGDVNQNYLLNS